MTLSTDQLAAATERCACPPDVPAHPNHPASRITHHRHTTRAGSVRGDGFHITADASSPITGMTFTRDAAAQFVRATIELADGTEHRAALTERAAGCWVPMGAETEGPSFGTYDDFMRLSIDDQPGAGLFEQGVLHRAC